jgi:hypothetical protein
MTDPFNPTSEPTSARLDGETLVEAARFVISLEVKDSDAFQELCWALPEGQKWIKFCEYASVELTCEVRDGAPVILSARFLQ